MLKRIIKIKNIGRFVDCYPAGCEFAKETIIFGYNTQGKSMLTAILRSIQTGNNDIIIGRKTFGATTDKYVEIDFEEGGANDKYVFQKRVWNKSNPNILIFDSKFITENIFEGENITFDQQKSLNTVIIGKKGQDLHDEIVELQNKSDGFAKQKAEKTREFKQHFKELSFEEFKSLAKDDKIDKKINGKDMEIKFELEKGDIKKAIKSYIYSVSEIRFSIRDNLAKTLDVKQEEIEKHIKSHFSTHENARTFLSEGLEFLKEKPTDGNKRTCVFCGQELEVIAESLINHYSAFFKGGYEQLQIEISKAIDYFKGVNLEAILEKIAVGLKAKGLAISSLDESTIGLLTDLKKRFEKELDRKRDLNYSVDFNTFDSLKAGVEQIEKDLEELEQKKINIPSPKPLSDLEKEKRKLEIIKKRYEPLWVQFCAELDKIEIATEPVRVARERKRKELEAYSSGIFDTHKGTINQLCAAMCADFEIEDFKPLRKLVGKGERIFSIKFFGSYKVSLDNADEQTPNFRNTLSESDKRLLAFAFFLSLLSHDREIDKKIILLDDPMSSFDSERRRRTVHLITDIVCKYKEANGTEKSLPPRQKIILTHEIFFAKELARVIPSARTLKIEEYTDNVQKRSKIVHTDFSKDFPDDDISHRIEKIKGILDNRTFTTAFEVDCRVVLEHIFKRKYYIELKNEIAQKMSVRTFVNKMNQEKVSGFDEKGKFSKFTRLCDDLNIELHDNNSINSSGDKESILKDFFDCLKEI
jgi:wobble nucleotide-excising tRNase